MNYCVPQPVKDTQTEFQKFRLPEYFAVLKPEVHTRQQVRRLGDCVCERPRNHKCVLGMNERDRNAPQNENDIVLVWFLDIDAVALDVMYFFGPRKVSKRMTIGAAWPRIRMESIYHVGGRANSANAKTKS